jgi:uncharacterized protein (DUF433 family)
LVAEFDCDQKLKYAHSIKAIEAVSGYKTEKPEGVVIERLIDKIKFATPYTTILGIMKARNGPRQPVIRKDRPMNWEDRITIDPKVLVGKPIIKGTRIAVEFIVELLARGWSVEQILREYDHLAAEDIRACLAYASDTLKSEHVYLLPGA